MSDPRMIPADEAKRLRGAATPGPWYVEELDEGWYLLLGSDPDRPFTFPHIAEMEEAGDADLARLAPDLAHTVVEQAARIEQLDTELRARAADTLEYRVEHQHIENGVWHPLTQWSPEWPLNDGYSVASDERIVCRRVSHPWEVTDV